MAKLSVFSVAVSILLCGSVHADLDPASPLLRGSGKSPSLETLDSGRFIINKSVRTPKSQVTVEVKKNEAQPPVSIAKPEVDKSPVDTNSSAEASTVVSSDTSSTSVVIVKPNPEPTPTPPSEPSPKPTTEGEMNFMEKMRLMVLGTTDKELEQLRSKEVARKEGQNILEIDLSPTYFYFNSSSAYSVRRQSSSSPGFSGGLSVWVSPYFAIQAQTQESLGAAISDMSTGSLSGQTFTRNRIGLAFRSIDLDSTESAQTAWGIYYSEFQSAIAGSVNGRVKTKSSGIMISFDAKIPSGANYNHTLGVSIEPKLSHKETSKSQNIKTGTGNISSALSARLGGEIRFQRQNQIFWMLEHRYEKNLFKGQSTFADPITGATPDGVSVDQGLSLFSIGYRWGK